jgi:hypothetical protein
MTEGSHVSAAAKSTREIRTITVDCHNEAAYLQLLGERQCWV